MKLLAEDCVKVGLCVRGQKAFCVQHGIDFRDFFKNGIDVADVAHIKDDNLTSALNAAAVRTGRET